MRAASSRGQHEREPNNSRAGTHPREPNNSPCGQCLAPLPEFAGFRLRYFNSGKLAAATD